MFGPIRRRGHVVEWGGPTEACQGHDLGQARSGAVRGRAGQGPASPPNGRGGPMAEAWGQFGRLTSGWR